MKIRNPLLIEILSFAVSILIRVWMATLRFRYEPLGPCLDPRKNKDGRKFLYAFWHENILVPAYQFRDLGIAVLISKHADGQLIARAVERLGFATARGSSTRGGVEALKGMIRQAQKANIAITPDGPRGPRRKAQSGVAYLASATGCPVVPFAVGFGSARRLKSWDRFALPTPFSRVWLLTGDPIEVPANLDENRLDHFLKLIQDELDRLQILAEQRASGQPTPGPMSIKKAA